MDLFFSLVPLSVLANIGRICTAQGDKVGASGAGELHALRTRAERRASRHLTMARCLAARVLSVEVSMSDSTKRNCKETDRDLRLLAAMLCHVSVQLVSLTGDEGD